MWFYATVDFHATVDKLLKCGFVTVDYHIFIYEIGKRIAEKSGEKRETLWLKQRLNIAIQKGNALAILSLARHMSGLG